MVFYLLPWEMIQDIGSIILTPNDPLNLCVKLFGMLGKTGHCSTTRFGLNSLNA